jgi:oligopeptide transport system substrate-binding protein
MSTRPLTLASLLVLGLCALAGCFRGSADADGGLMVLHFGNGTEPQDLDPQVVTGVPENKIVNSLFEGLVVEAADGVGTAPGVAERWSVSADGLVWTFHLRANARWSDGQPLTAADFLASYRRILTPSLGAEYAYKLHHVIGAEAYNRGELTDFTQTGFKALDDHTLQITLRHRTPFLLDAMKHYSWFPVPTHVIARHGGLARKGSAWTRPENIVGNGPFVMRSWVPNQKIVVERSPTYWDAATVGLDQIHFYAIESMDTEERMFRTGRLHRTNELPLSKIIPYRRDHPEAYRQDPYYGTYFYRLNVTRPPLDDVRVRRALALAIDRESLVNNVTRGGQQPAYNFCPPSDHFESRARLEGDLATARALLAEAGYPEGRGFPRVDLLFNTSENHRVIAEAIQQMWRRNLGINVGLTNQEWKVYLDSQRTLSYDICRAGWIGDYPDPHTFMDMWVTDGGNNNTGWSHAEYDRLAAASLQSATEEERFAIYQRMDQILAEEVPIIPIYFYTRIYALDPRVQGWPPNLLDNRAWKYVRLAPRE